MSADHDRPSGSHVTASCADVLSDVLRTVHLTGSMLFVVDASAPWRSWAPATEAFRRVVLPASQHLVSFHVVVEGACWGALRDAPAERLEAGDVLVVPHGDAYYLANPIDARATYGEPEAVAFFRQMAAGEMPSTVREGAGGMAHTRFVCGFLGCDRRPFNPLLAALPPMLHLKAAAADRMRPLLDVALGELGAPRTGTRDVLRRLAELMFIEVVRRHLEGLPERRSGWLAALRDPLVGRALALLHGAPSDAWTLDALAARAGASRSVLAERFTRLVGQPPMQYLTAWRMQVAARLLGERGAKVSAVAHDVGYASEAAFSRAFARCVGMAPVDWRRAGSAALDADAGANADADANANANSDADANSGANSGANAGANAGARSR